MSLLLLPGLFVVAAWHITRYYHQENTESKLISPDWYPAPNKLLVNERTQVGGFNTTKWIEHLPEAERFEPTYFDTYGDENFYRFNSEVYDYCVNNATEFPWSYGSY